MCTFLLVSQNEGHKVEFTPLKDEFQTERVYVKKSRFLRVLWKMGKSGNTTLLHWALS